MGWTRKDWELVTQTWPKKIVIYAKISAGVDMRIRVKNVEFFEALVDRLVPPGDPEHELWELRVFIWGMPDQMLDRVITSFEI